MLWHSDERGQSTVEAAFLIPVLLLVLGLFIQPVCLLYCSCVMNYAAAEGCRVYATNNALSNAEEVATAYVERRLSAIPNIAIFHNSDEWNISFTVKDNGVVVCTIKNKAATLPLFGITTALAGYMSSKGNVVQYVKVKSHCIPKWAAKLSTGPADWISNWE